MLVIVSLLAITMIAMFAILFNIEETDNPYIFLGYWGVINAILIAFTMAVDIWEGISNKIIGG